MIIQDHLTYVRCITQHDHGRLSGELASVWKDPATGLGANEELVIATYLHDVLWVPMDHLPRVDAQSLRPLDFLAYPESDKLAGYEFGIDQIQTVDAYVALLHALHFSEFVRRDLHPGFRQRMDKRIEDLRAILGVERCATVDEDLALLRLFDVFSLLLCMTGPTIARTPPPWLNPSPHLTRRGMRAWWEDDALILDPYCFEAPLDVSIPYRDLPRGLTEAAFQAAFLAAPLESFHVKIRPSTGSGLV